MTRKIQRFLKSKAQPGIAEICVKALSHLLLVTFIFLTTTSSFATEIYENWISARAAGMGNAYSSVVADKDALYYNPAAIDRIHGFHVTVLDANIGTDAVDMYNTIQQATGANYAQIIHDFYGKPVWVGVNDQFAFSMHDLALAVFDNFNLSFNLTNPAYPSVSMDVTNDLGAIFGGAFSLTPDGSVRMGFAIKRITRYGGRTNFGPSTLATLSNTQLTNLTVNNYGTGYGADVGLLVEFPTPVHPCFSAVWQDIGQTAFNIGLHGTQPPSIDNNAIAGFSMDLDAVLFRFRPSLEFRHINLYSEEIGKRINAGGEFLLPLGFIVRGGANQGYYTAGLGFDFKYLHVDAATYGVELDTYPGQLEDRRYVVQATLDFNIDFNFSSDGPGGSSGRAEDEPFNPHFERR